MIAVEIGSIIATAVPNASVRMTIATPMPIASLTCVDGSGTLLMPCGRCRQVLLEHGGPDMLVDHPRGPVPISVLLPDAFGPDDLARGQKP